MKGDFNEEVCPSLFICSHLPIKVGKAIFLEIKIVDVLKVISLIYNCGSKLSLQKRQNKGIKNESKAFSCVDGNPPGICPLT